MRQVTWGQFVCVMRQVTWDQRSEYKVQLVCVCVCVCNKWLILLPSPLKNVLPCAMCAGPSLAGLTPDAETSFESVARGDLERLLGAWGAADVALVDFSFQRLSEAEGYSFVVDSGSRLYRLDIRPGSTPYTMGLIVMQY